MTHPLVPGQEMRARNAQKARCQKLNNQGRPKTGTEMQYIICSTLMRMYGRDGYSLTPFTPVDKI